MRPPGPGVADPAQPRGGRSARIESRLEVSICRCSGIRAWPGTTRMPEVVLLLFTALDLHLRTDPCQGRPVAINAAKEPAHVLIGALYVDVPRRVHRRPGRRAGQSRRRRLHAAARVVFRGRGIRPAIRAGRPMPARAFCRRSPAWRRTRRCGCSPDRPGPRRSSTIATRMSSTTSNDGISFRPNSRYSRKFSFRVQQRKVIKALSRRIAAMGEGLWRSVRPAAARA